MCFQLKLKRRQRGREAGLEWQSIPNSRGLELKVSCTTTFQVDTRDRQKFLRGGTKRSAGGMRTGSRRPKVVECHESTERKELPET